MTFGILVVLVLLAMLLLARMPADLRWQMLSGLSKYMRKSAKEKEKK